MNVFITIVLLFQVWHYLKHIKNDNQGMLVIYYALDIILLLVCVSFVWVK